MCWLHWDVVTVGDGPSNLGDPLFPPGAHSSNFRITNQDSYFIDGVESVF